MADNKDPNGPDEGPEDPNLLKSDDDNLESSNTTDSDEPQEDAQEEPKKKKGSWLTAPFRFAARGLWWATKTPFVFTAKKTGAGIKNAKTFKGKAGAVLTGVLATAFLAAVYGYAGSFALVKAVDWNAPGNFPATKGAWSGDFVRWSHKGTFPCDSWEGGIRTGDASQQSFFAVRRTQTELIDALQKIWDKPGTADIDLTYHDLKIPQSAFGAVEEHPQTGEFIGVDPVLPLGCVQHFDHVAKGVNYYDPASGESITIPDPNNPDKNLIQKAWDYLALKF